MLLLPDHQIVRQYRSDSPYSLYVMHMEVEAVMVTGMATEINMVMAVNMAMVTAMEEVVDKASKKNRRNNITKIQ